jgi:type II secretory pathway pseudopilin PulG
MEPPTASGRAAARGFTYMSLLFFIAVLGIGLAATAISWQTARQRDRERELLRIGAEFQEAIALYYKRSPGAIREFPKHLDDLVKDPRYPHTQRYLRRIYRDPTTGLARWGMVAAPGGGIMGVYSLSAEKPIKSGGFPGQGSDFDAAATYSDWKFVYQPPTLPAGPQSPAINPASTSGESMTPAFSPVSGITRSAPQ